MYPQLPDATTLAGLSATELRTLASEFRAAHKAAAIANPQMSAEEFAEWEGAAATARVLSTLAAEADADAADNLANEAAAVRETEKVVETDTDKTTEKTTETTVEPVVDPPAAPAEQPAPEQPDTEAATTVVPTTLSLGGTTTIERPKSGWISTGKGGVTAGHEFTSTVELAETFQELANSVGNDNEKRVIARMPSNMPEDRILTSEQLFTDLNQLTNLDDEIQAAFCTPLTPLYGLSCANVTRRPVFGGLPQFQPDANRGGFRVPESPSLFDITGGFGQWTSANDADPNAIKNACQTIVCTNWNDFEWYGTYRCLKVKNLMAMTFPELVDAYLNRLQARWARYAEVLLLEQMGTASTSVAGIATGYGANVSLQRNILTYLGKYAEIERWDEPMMDAWMPRWLLWALRMDIASRRKDGGGMIPSVATVEQGFRDVGVEPHWYMDRPSWATPINPLAVAGNLTHFPSQVQILIHRRGKFAVMDKGELTVGLGGNPIRIEDDLMRNQATFFFESFEGLIDTDSCPAHLLTVPNLCYNGQQIADVLIRCEGQEVVGTGS